MPASRSRTIEWKRCLQQLQDRNGALEIAIASCYDGHETAANDLIWRVRILQLNDTDLVVECPQALGRELEIEQGIELIAVIAIGQNRWMFRTANLGTVTLDGPGRQPSHAMRLAMPDGVERCQRRNFYRVQVAAISLPEVDVWPLLDPRSVVVAERANELRGLSPNAAAPSDESPDSLTLPEVGPKFQALLVNIGGGGVGLAIEPADAGVLHRHKVLWVRFSLTREIPAPVCATAKVVHTHIDSTQRTYAGLSFDFSHNPAHQKFVVDQICRYISLQQRAQLKQSA